MKITSNLKYLIKKMKTQNSLKDFKAIHCVSLLFLAPIENEDLYEKGDSSCNRTYACTLICK